MLLGTLGLPTVVGPLPALQLHPAELEIVAKGSELGGAGSISATFGPQCTSAFPPEQCDVIALVEYAWLV